MARCNGARVELHRAGTFSLEEFRDAVQETSTSENEHLIASYSRKEFLQTGNYRSMLKQDVSAYTEG